jgi:ParB family chromosome partitioning protein
VAKRVLGRGLEALLSDNEQQEALIRGERVVEVPLSAIAANPHQPRKSFSEEKIRELADSIREKGVLQPLLLRPSTRGGYEIVAGERRFRAAEMLGYGTIPAVIRDVPDRELLEIALVENIQREDLDPVELAGALQRLQAECGYTHQDLAQRLGKDRTSITNALRLLRLPEKVRLAVSRADITAGHARALAGLPTAEAQEHWCARVMREGLSVRALEGLLSSSGRGGRARDRIRRKPRLDATVTELIERLQMALGTRVRLHAQGRGGRIEIEYYSQEELERLIGILLRETS